MKPIKVNDIELKYRIEKGKLTLATYNGSRAFIFSNIEPKQAIKVLQALLDVAIGAQIQVAKEKAKNAKRLD